MEELKKICFDVLQDFISEKDYEIMKNPKGEYRVMVWRCPKAFVPLIREDWDKKVKGTEFEKVSLYLPKAD